MARTTVRPDRPVVMFERIAIVGTGLIGASFALAAQRILAGVRIVGWDRDEVLRKALACGAIHEAESEMARALEGADLVYVALPIGLTLGLLPALARDTKPYALVTDACSTKAAIIRTAALHFHDSTRFLGGHPLAGKEVSGVENADADLFRGSRYALIGDGSEADPRVKEFTELVRHMGCEPVWLDAETHDWAAAIISHLPQLLSIALAAVVRDETNESGLPLSLAGSGLRDLLRLAGSPYALWRDICLTNRDNIAWALDRLAQALDHVRLRLADRQLQDEFRAANDLYDVLRGLK